MDSEIIERLDILCSSGQINCEQRDKTIEVVKYVEEKYSKEIRGEIGGMFATHLAKSISRINDGEGIESISQDLLDAVNDRQDIIMEARYILHDFVKLQTVPEGEVFFTAVYIKLLLES